MRSGEISYVWGYHELGFWGAFNAGKGLGITPPARWHPFENNSAHLQRILSSPVW